MLSSFFWGYVVTQIPSSYIATIWSGQKLLSIGMLICGVLNVVLPIVASSWGLVAVLVCRVGMGLTQACLLPCTHALLSKWVPPSERARLGENSHLEQRKNIIKIIKSAKSFCFFFCFFLRTESTKKNCCKSNFLCTNCISLSIN